MVNVIVAVSLNNAVGFNNALPWPRIPEDMKWFKRHTANNVVVMGRKTWESIGSKPLPNRINYLVTSKSYIEGADGVITQNIEQSLQLLKDKYPTKKIFVIGGPSLYNSVVNITERFYITWIKQEYIGDTFFNPLQHLDNFEEITCLKLDAIDNLPSLDFCIYKRKKGTRHA